MKTLNKNSNRIFCQLLEKMNGKEYLKMENEGFLPLSIERLFGILVTPLGEAEHYSLMHTYTQNGDLMKDPEMCFLVYNAIDGKADPEQIQLIPYMYQQDNLGIYQEGIVIYDSTTVEFFLSIIADHAEFSDLWLTNIEAQGFLTVEAEK